MRVFALEVRAIHVGNFQFATLRRLDALGNLDNIVIVEIQAGYRVVGLRLQRLLFDTQRAASRIKLDNAETFRIGDVIAKNRRTLLLGARRTQIVREVLTVEDVITQNQAARILTDELFADDERLRQTIWARLFGVAEFDPINATVAQQLAETRQIFRGGNNQNFAHASEHQHRQRIKDHRLVVDRQHLLGDAKGQRMQARARATGENDAFTICRGHLFRTSLSIRVTPLCQSGKCREKLSRSF